MSLHLTNDKHAARPWSALLGGLALALSVACRHESASGPARRVIVISCDTLRADRLGVYGHDGATSPSIDAFARDAVVYDEAFSCAPLTGPALSSLLSGRMPDELGVAAGNRFLMPPEVRTYAEVCSDAGVATAAVVSNWVLRKMPAALGDVGVQQGFAVFDDEMSTKEKNRDAYERVAPDTTRAALSWLERAKASGDDRFFLWVHYQDPHGPYTPPTSFARPFEPTHASGRELPLGQTNKGKGQVPAYQVVDGERDPAAYRARYDGEIRYFDESVGKLLAWLQTNGWYEDALIVFTADHGESLGEHDYWFCHGENVYRETVRVPLVIRFPKGAAGPDAPRAGDFRRVSALVSHLDLWPTMLDALGLRAPANRGSSLFARTPPADRVAVQTLASTSDAARWTAISDGRHRLIVEGKLAPRLFDARKDLEEAHDLADAQPDRVRELAARLHEFLNASPGVTVPGTPMRVDPANEAAMKRLGYTEGSDGE